MPGPRIGRQFCRLLLPRHYAVDPDKVELLFERFMSTRARRAADIDVDFEHERREEVIQYIYEIMAATVPPLRRL